MAKKSKSLLPIASSALASPNRRALAAEVRMKRHFEVLEVHVVGRLLEEELQEVLVTPQLGELRGIDLDDLGLTVSLGVGESCKFRLV